MSGSTTKKSPITATSTMARRNRKSSVDHISNNLRKFINKIPHPISPPLTSPRTSTSMKLELDDDIIVNEDTIEPGNSNHNNNSDSSQDSASATKTQFKSKQLPPISPSQEQIDLIRLSWEKVSKLKHDLDDSTLSPSNAFGREFFAALFEMDIGCKKALKNTFQQARALSGIIMFIVRAPSLSTMSMNHEKGEGAVHCATTIAYNSNNNKRAPSSICKSQSTFESNNSSITSNTSDEDSLGALPFGDTTTTTDDKPQQKQKPVLTIRELNAAARKRANSDTVQPRKTSDSSCSYKEMDSAKMITLIKDTGARHFFYSGVMPDFFDLVGPAFVVALQKRLGEDYTSDVGEAWIQASKYIAYYMKIGYNTQQAWEEQQHQQKSVSNSSQLLGANKGDCTIQ